MIAQEADGSLPASEMWHKDLLAQIATPNVHQDSVISNELQSQIKPYLAFRHMFRGASVVLMRWDKLCPLATDARNVLVGFENEIQRFLSRRPRESD